MHTIYVDANLPEPWSDNWMSFSGNENADVDVNHKKKKKIIIQLLNAKGLRLV